MKTYTPKTIYAKLGANPSERQILYVAAMMMREESKIFRNNIFTLNYYMDMVKIAWNTGAICACFNSIAD